MKIKLIGLLFLSLYVFNACHENYIEPDNTQNITIKNIAEFIYDLKISGDEEGANIITMAKHAKVCEITRNSATDWNCVFTYIPVENYVGSDIVEIETCTGGEGLKCSNLATIKFIFEITN